MSTLHVTSRADFRQSQLVERADTALSAGQIRLRVERFGLSANNVTYAVLGNEFSFGPGDWGYFDFFPSGDEGQGVVPVWGIGEVSESQVEGIEPGQKFYGYFGFGDSQVLEPAGVNPRGFTDNSAHRRELPAAYQGYVAFPAAAQAQANMWAVWKPLHITGWTVADQLAETTQAGDGDGFQQLVLSSASSKTAIMSAFCIREMLPNAGLIGLTSAGHVGYVRSLGLYDDVLRYEEVDALAPQTSAYVDFAGNRELTAKVHDQLGDQLGLSLIVGMSHWTQVRGPKPAVGPELTGFFAPGRVAYRAKQWGPGELFGRIEANWQRFLAASDGWTQIVEHQGLDTAQEVFAGLMKGQLDPSQSLVILP